VARFVRGEHPHYIMHIVRFCSCYTCILYNGVFLLTHASDLRPKLSGVPSSVERIDVSQQVGRFG